MSEMCCTRLAKNRGCKKSPFWHHRTTYIGLYLCTWGMYWHVLIIWWTYAY